MTIRTRLRNLYEDLLPKAGCAGAVAGAYIAATIALNAAAIPITAGVNGIERLVGAKENTYEARLVKEGFSQLINTKGMIFWGDFVTSKGDTLRLYDGADVLNGKILPNTQLGKAQIGKNYRITSLEGSLSNKLLKLQSLEAQK